MNEKVQKFIDYFKNQDVERRVLIRDSFLEKTGLRYPAWYAKIRRKAFSPLELAALSEITGEEFTN
ncbi:MAG: hypothetical protein J5965_26130 [Aeriscardovia sp.]|nr:hypothetical protein [Aeriscardovia sp.]